MRIPAPRARRARPLAAALAAAAFALPAPQARAQDETRALGAHVHGVGALQIAFDGDEIALRFEAPAADLVGFERAPRTDEERSAVQAAVAALEDPLTLFAFAPAAGCTVRSAEAALTGLGEDDHDHADHDHDHGHGHSHGDDAHAHDDHDHGAEAFHAEFHADVLLTCTSPEAADAIEALYFQRFPNARRLEATVIGPAGAQMLEATPQAPRLSLRGVL